MTPKIRVSVSAADTDTDTALDTVSVSVGNSTLKPTIEICNWKLKWS
jgi:hypothetical protein